MNENSDSTAVLARALRAAAQAFMEVLDEDGQGQSAAMYTDETAQAARRRIAYDPLNDEVPLAQNPGPGAPEAQQQMTSVTYLGAIARINAQEGRGANSKEVTKHAKKAGYSGGNAVNGWNSRAGSSRLIENIDGARYLNQAGHDYLQECADALGIDISGDITPLDIPEH